MTVQDEQSQSSTASASDNRDQHKTERLTGTGEGGEDLPYDGAGEDDGSTSVEGDDGHLTDDQKPTSK